MQLYTGSNQNQVKKACRMNQWTVFKRELSHGVSKI